VEVSISQGVVSSFASFVLN